MDAQLLLFIGAGCIAAAGVILFFVVATGSTKITGVARSLEMVQGSVAAEEVGRSELPFSDRFVSPFFARMKRMALRLSPSGTSDRLLRLLDLAGNPKGLTLERLLGFKGAGLLVGGFLGLFVGGLSL